MTAADEYGVIGYPVSHSWSPFIHGLFARQTGQNLVYRLHEVPPAEFAAFVERFFEAGGKGLNVTLPHKPAAAEFAAEMTVRAARAGAVNTLALRADGRVLGDNTDGAGLVRDLETHLGLKLAGQRMLVLGAGGATRGILGPLLEREPVELVVANRARTRALEVTAVFKSLGNIRGCALEELAPEPVDLVINATAASLQGEVPALNPALIGPQTVCYDLAYGHGDTAFLDFARHAGAARLFQGWGMLVEQAAESFELWRGVRPDSQAVLEALQNHPRG
jgi:shikimate dehydrogenase